MDPHDLRRLDEIASDATSSPIEVDLDGWWCKAAPDVPFRRCNVARPPMGAGGDPEATRRALGEVRDWYGALGLRLIVQVSSADPSADALDRVLAAEGLVMEAPVHLMVRALAESADARAEAGTEAMGGVSGGAERVPVSVRAGVDEAWARSFGVIHGGSAVQEQRTVAYGRMLAAFGERALAATVRASAGASDRENDGGGATIGLGYGVLDRGWLGIFGMGTATEHRRRGIASAIVGALAHAAADRGAEAAYLQVETDNTGAIACYERLGFTISHGYHYRSEGLDHELGC